MHLKFHKELFHGWPQKVSVAADKTAVLPAAQVEHPAVQQAAAISALAEMPELDKVAAVVLARTADCTAVAVAGGTTIPRPRRPESALKGEFWWSGTD
jgi:hypothetical protein